MLNRQTCAETGNIVAEKIYVEMGGVGQVGRTAAPFFLHDLFDEILPPDGSEDGKCSSPGVDPVTIEDRFEIISAIYRFERLQFMCATPVKSGNFGYESLYPREYANASFSGCSCRDSAGNGMCNGSL